MSVNTWIKLILAGAYTFTLAGILLGSYAALVARTQMPEGTSLAAGVLWILGAIGMAVVFGILGFLAIVGVERWLGV